MLLRQLLLIMMLVLMKGIGDTSIWSADREIQ